MAEDKKSKLTDENAEDVSKEAEAVEKEAGKTPDKAEATEKTDDKAIKSEKKTKAKAEKKAVSGSSKAKDKSEKEDEGDDIFTVSSSKKTGKIKHNKIKGTPKAQKQKQKTKSKFSKVIKILVTVLIVLIIVTPFTWYTMATNGVMNRTNTVMSSDNYNYSVNLSMMTYWFNSSYRSYVNNYSSYLSYLGLDTDTDLKDQEYSGGGTWYDYFVSSTESQVQQYLVLCEAAKAAGVTLDDSDYESIDTNIKTLKDSATEYGYSLNGYLDALYGNGVRISDIRDCLKISSLATKYATQVSDSYTYTDDDYDAEVNSDSYTDYLKVNYMTYTFTVDDTTDETTEDTSETTAATDETTAETTAEETTAETTAEETTAEETSTDETTAEETTSAEPTAAEEAALTYMNGLAACTDEESFTAYLTDYLNNVEYATEEDADTKASSVESDLESATKTDTEYSSGDFGDWAFSAERQPYEVMTDEDSYTVYMLLPPTYETDGYSVAFRDEYTTRNMGHIVLDSSEYDDDITQAATAAEDIVSQLTAEEVTEDSFKAMFDEYDQTSTDDPITENVQKDGTGVTVIDDWLYADDTSVGAVTSVYDDTDDDATEVYILWYESDGLVAWKAQADSNLRSADYDEEYSTYEETYTISTDNDAISTIIPVTIQSSDSSTTTTSAS